MRGERPDEIGEARKADQEDARAHSRMAGLHLWEPEPRVERGEDEDEREGIDRRDQEPDDAERQQCGAVPRQPLLRSDRSSGQKATAGHGPARTGEEDQRKERTTRPGDRAERRSGATRAPPEAEGSEDDEDRSDPGPETEPAAVAAQSG